MLPRFKKSLFSYDSGISRQRRYKLKVIVYIVVRIGNFKTNTGVNFCSLKNRCAYASYMQIYRAVSNYFSKWHS
jgi:hypothetical protein